MSVQEPDQRVDTTENEKKPVAENEAVKENEKKPVTENGPVKENESIKEENPPEGRPQEDPIPKKGIAKILECIKHWWNKKDYKEKNRVYFRLMAVSAFCSAWVGAIFGKLDDPYNMEKVFKLVFNFVFIAVFIVFIFSEYMQWLITSNMHRLFEKNNVDDLVDLKHAATEAMRKKIEEAGVACEMQVAQDIYSWAREQEKDERGVI